MAGEGEGEDLGLLVLTARGVVLGVEEGVLPLVVVFVLIGVEDGEGLGEGLMRTGGILMGFDDGGNYVLVGSVFVRYCNRKRSAI